jgi:hypothetical protein
LAGRFAFLYEAAERQQSRASRLDARMLRLAVLLGVMMAWLAPEPEHPRPRRQCTLAIPPPQVARVAAIEAVYGSAPIGWIVVAGPVDCE